MKTRIKSHVIIASSNGKRAQRRVATIAVKQKPVVANDKEPILVGIGYQRHNYNPLVS